MAQTPSPIRPRVTDARAYEAALRRSYLRPFVESILGKLAQATGTTDVWRALDSELDALEAKPQAGVPVAMVEAQIQRVEGYHRRRLIQTFRSALGVDVRGFLTRPAVAAYLTERIAENVGLIKTIPPRFHEGLRQRVADEFAAAPFDQQRLKTLFRDEYGSAGYNLRRLTRDQTNKQVGGLSRLRHSQLGIVRFTWRSSADERVRAEHARYDGQVYEWAKAPEGGPGMPIQCRCTAEPVIDATVTDRLGAKPPIRARKPKPTPQAPADMSPAQARKRFEGDYRRHGRTHGLSVAEKELRSADKAYQRAVKHRDDWYKHEGEPGFTVAERKRRAEAAKVAHDAAKESRDRYAQVRLDSERSAWGDMFGEHVPARGMDTAFVGSPSDAYKTNVTAAVRDFRRMVPASHLKRMGHIEISDKGLRVSQGDAGIAFTDPNMGRERYGGVAGGLKGPVYGGYPDARRRIRVKPDEPGSIHYAQTDPMLKGGTLTAPKIKGSTTTVHELGHHLEDSNPAMLRAAQEFIASRGRRYEWIDDYAKTRYADDATELVSVGIEQLYTRPAEFARRDPEYFDWIWRWVVQGGE